MRTSWPRNVTPMHEANERRWAAAKIAKAREYLESLGYRVIEPPGETEVKSDREAAS